MKVTLIIPTYRRPVDLERALQSVDTSIRSIVVVDDYSGPELQAAVSRVCGTDTRVSLILNPERKGAGQCRNLGAGKAQAEWLLFLDDDDQLTARYLKEMQGLLLSHSEVGAWVPDVQGAHPRKLSSVPLSDAQSRNRVGGCSGLFIRKAVFEAVGGFDGRFPSMQDWDLWLRLIERNALHYSGVTGVIYESCSAEKITHNLGAKYRGLRRLYFKHASAWTTGARKHHLMRLRALRLLLEPQVVSLGRLLVHAVQAPLVFAYYLKWKKYR